MARKTTRKPTLTASKQLAIETIARNILRLETLETRKMDSLDFHELHVGLIQDALLAAYEAGVLAERNRIALGQ